MSSVDLNDEQLLRYSRQILLSDIDLEGQQRLAASRVLVLGMGGLGSPVAMYLAGAGVGQLVLVDPDVVEISNLHRQFLHSNQSLGELKVESARQTLSARNPDVELITFSERLDETALLEQIKLADVVVDGTDNFETRYLVNAACVARSKPLVSGALSQWEGQLALFDPARSGPCYQCVFPSAPKPELAPSCAQAGVFAALPGIIGSLMAAEALKYILGAGTPLRGQMAIYNVLDAQNRVIKTKPRADCPICGANSSDGKS